MNVIRRPMQSTKWCFTVNNWTQVDEVILSNLGNDEFTKYLIFGREVGESGTPHLQGFILFTSNKRFNAVKNLLPPGTHIEAAKASAHEAALYCQKDHAFTEFGTRPTVPGKNNRYTDFRDWILLQPSKPSSAQIATEFPGIFLSSNKVQEFVDLIYPVVVDDRPVTYRGYQLALGSRLDEPAESRKIIFVVDPVGNSGKSFYAERYASSHPETTQILSIGRREDLSFAIDERKSVFLFDLPRSTGEFAPYTIFEQLKDRRIFSNKYQSRMKILTAPAVHVVVFMNEYPDMTKLSADRYEIIVWNHEFE